MCILGEIEDVDRLLWNTPPASSLSTSNDVLSFEFEFSEQSLPDVYKLAKTIDSADDSTNVLDDWVLFTEVSTVLSVNTADALVKLLDDKNAVMSMPVDQFNKCAISQKILSKQPLVVPTKSSNIKLTTEELLPKNASPETIDNDVTAERISPSTTGKQILLVRYDHKLKQLLGVDAHMVS